MLSLRLSAAITSLPNKGGPAGKKEDVHLLEIPEADHFDLIDPRTPAWKRIEQTVVDLVNPL